MDGLIGVVSNEHSHVVGGDVQPFHAKRRSQVFFFFQIKEEDIFVVGLPGVVAGHLVFYGPGQIYAELCAGECICVKVFKMLRQFCKFRFPAKCALIGSCDKASIT
ncbi:hypothetical protein PsAD46_01342 [Pseudovibrio sp. Ad46]|nr:hypothetical protein PsAD46_01342 [Pseudovibrio sp. Ad46]KZK98910.1 hypothetical protein PsAD5_01533 [Pseudovibrio sp. Ad5]